MKNIVVVLVVLGAFLGSGVAVAGPTSLSLPGPTGNFRVGSAVVPLVDESRPDQWVPSQRRELMTTVWYPALVTERPSAPTPYLTAAESTAFMATQKRDIPGDVLVRVGTHSVANALPIPAQRSRPLVVLSPGFSFPRATLTGLAEDLASRGYVVVAVDHTHESWGTSLPGGRFARCIACAGELDGPRVTSGRARDISFVISQYLEARSPWPGSVIIDPNRVAVGGHSIGGSSALQTMLSDDRVDAGFNFDGTFFPPLTVDVDRPFLILEAESHPEADTSIDETRAHLTGPSEHHVIAGTTHSSFTDLAPLADAIGSPLQKLPGITSMKLTRNMTATFLAKYLG